MRSSDRKARIETIAKQSRGVGQHIRPRHEDGDGFLGDGFKGIEHSSYKYIQYVQKEWNSLSAARDYWLHVTINVALLALVEIFCL